MSSKLAYGTKRRRLTPEEMADAHECDRLDVIAERMSKHSSKTRVKKSRCPSKVKNKAARRAWWYSLTPEQQNAYVEKKVAALTKQRIKDMLKKGTESKNCTNCLLGVGEHCDGYGQEYCCDDWFAIER